MLFKPCILIIEWKLPAQDIAAATSALAFITKKMRHDNKRLNKRDQKASCYAYDLTSLLISLRFLFPSKRLSHMTC